MSGGAARSKARATRMPTAELAMWVTLGAKRAKRGERAQRERENVKHKGKDRRTSTDVLPAMPAESAST